MDPRTARSVASAVAILVTVWAVVSTGDDRTVLLVAAAVVAVLGLAARPADRKSVV